MLIVLDTTAEFVKGLVLAPQMEEVHDAPAAPPPGVKPYVVPKASWTVAAGASQANVTASGLPLGAMTASVTCCPDPDPSPVHPPNVTVNISSVLRPHPEGLEVPGTTMLPTMKGVDPVLVTVVTPKALAATAGPTR